MRRFVIGFGFFLICFCAKAQAQLPKINIQLSEDKKETVKYPSLNSILQSDSKIHGQSIPSIYSYKDLAFFCRMEVKIEKSAKVPFKFRLGDVKYVDYLEQKIDSY